MAKLISSCLLSEGKIQLRPGTEADVDPMFQAIQESLPELCRFSWWCHPEYSREEARLFLTACAPAWEQDQAYFFVIEDRETGEFLGSCGLNQVDRVNLRANLGYWVRASRHCQGIATAATRLLTKFGFQELGLVRLEILAEVENRASQRVAEKAGFIREGVLKQRLRRQEKNYDAVIFCRLKGEETWGTESRV